MEWGVKPKRHLPLSILPDWQIPVWPPLPLAAIHDVNSNNVCCGPRGRPLGLMHAHRLYAGFGKSNCILTVSQKISSSIGCQASVNKKLQQHEMSCPMHGMSSQRKTLVGCRALYPSARDVKVAILDQIISWAPTLAEASGWSISGVSSESDCRSAACSLRACHESCSSASRASRAAST